MAGYCTKYPGIHSATEGKPDTVSRKSLKKLKSVSPWSLRVKRWLANKNTFMWFGRFDNDVRARERGSLSALTSSLVATPCLRDMVSTTWRGVSM
jgi:hypothetical protein